METVYKVVRVDGSSGKRYSCMHWYGTPSKHNLDEGIVLEYTQGRITKPKFGQILAFDNLTDANLFIGHSLMVEVWRCATPRFIQVIRLAESLYIPSGEPFNHLIRYWKEKFRMVSTMSAPPGTVACPQVCLKELMIRNG